MEQIPGMFTAKKKDPNEDNDFWNMHDENDDLNRQRYENMSREERFRYEFQ